MTARLDTSGAVTQFAVLDALLAGAYESGITVDELLDAGDFGVGCVEHLGGGVVIVDGGVFECTLDAAPDRMARHQVLPFVSVCRFSAGPTETLARCDLAAFTARVESGLVSRNLFHAVRVDCAFASVRVRVTQRQDPPFRPLAEVATEQIETVLADVRGTIVGFWSPTIYQGIAVAGLHMHFIAEDRSAGGHVLDLTIDDARMQLAAYSRLELRLPTDATFLQTELNHDADGRIVTVEGGAAG